MPKAYFNALSAYHELAGDLDLALKIRDRQLAELSDRGRFADECACRIERCRLLLELGRPAQEELAAARMATTRLRAPQRFVEAIDRLERGDG